VIPLDRVAPPLYTEAMEKSKAKLVAVMIVSALAWVPEEQRDVIIRNLDLDVRREVRDLLP